MKMKRMSVILFCVLVLTLSVSANKNGSDIAKIAGEVYGNVLIEYYPKDGVGSSYSDIYKFHNEWVTKDGDWFSNWCWRLFSCTAPTHIPSRVGIQPWKQDRIKVSIQEAIRKFHQLNCGDKFVGKISLYWPLTPVCPEPFYEFTSNLNCVIHIGATTGKVTDLSDKNKALCALFDYDIEQAFKHYGIGVDVELLHVTGKPISIEPGYCCDVMLRVAPVVPHAKAVADTWHFCGGLIYKTTGPVPSGIRIIDKNKLIGCCKAAEIVKKKFPKFQVEKATVSLAWVLYPGTRPCYSFVLDDISHAVDAYNGTLYE
jgi:hypothetical protein